MNRVLLTVAAGLFLLAVVSAVFMVLTIFAQHDCDELPPPPPQISERS